MSQDIQFSQEQVDVMLQMHDTIQALQALKNQAAKVGIILYTDEDSSVPFNMCVRVEDATQLPGIYAPDGTFSMDAINAYTALMDKYFNRGERDAGPTLSSGGIRLPKF